MVTIETFGCRNICINKSICHFSAEVPIIFAEKT